jgi:hypothetical protein
MTSFKNTLLSHKIKLWAWNINALVSWFEYLTNGQKTWHHLYDRAALSIWSS